jgi:hypothetical protein
MRNIILVGASHGRHLHKALKTLPGYGTEFTVNCLCESGKKFFDLKWPVKVNSTDYLVVIPFGNDLQPRSNVHFTGGTAHLVRFQPYSNQYWENLFQGLRARLADRNCEVRIIDNFYRHLCCHLHTNPGWLSYQTTVNKEIRRNFHGDRCQVIDHRSLLPLTYKKARKIPLYKELLKDSVHFRNYRPIAERLLSIL